MAWHALLFQALLRCVRSFSMVFKSLIGLRGRVDSGDFVHGEDS